MRIRTITAIIMVFALTQFMLSACKKTKTTPATAPQPSPETHQQEMLKKSFEESKKAVAAKVNGQAITMFSLLREMNELAPQYLTRDRKRTPELEAEIRNHALNMLIFQELAVQEASKRGMKVKPEIIDSEVKKMKADKGSVDAFQRHLVDNGLTENEFRKTIERDYLFELIAAEEIDAKITVTDAALRERYNREKAGLMTQDASHRDMTFEEARGVLERKIRAEAAEKRMREWQKELRNNARIEIIEQKRKRA